MSERQLQDSNNLSGDKLNAALVTQFRNSLGPKAYFAITIDSSGSVWPQQTEQMKAFSSAFVTLCGPDATTLITTFNDEVTVVQPLTNDTQQLHDAITRIDTKNRGGTLAGSAILTLGGLLRGPTVPANAAVGIVLLTDGDVHDVTQQVQSFVIQNKIKLLVVGIGQHASSVTSLASCATTLHLPTWERFSALSVLLGSAPSSPPSVKVLTRTTRGAVFEVISLDDISSATVEVYYNNKWHAWTASGAKIAITGLLPATFYQARCHVTYKSNGVQSAWSETITFTTLSEYKLSRKLRDPKLRERLEQKLRRFITDYTVPEPLRALGCHYLNLLVLARMGNGKTAYLNTTNSAKKGMWAPLGLSKKSAGHVTTKITQYMLTPHIYVGDTFGWRAGMLNYVNILEMLVSGNLSYGYEEEKPIKNFLNPNPSISQRAGAVILIVEMDAVYLEDQMADCRKMYDKLTNMGVPVFFLMTKLDTKAASYEYSLKLSEIENIYENCMVREAIEQFCEATQVPDTCVVPIVNYSDQGQFSNSVINILVMRALVRAIKAAEARLLADAQNAVFFRKPDGTVLSSAIPSAGLGVYKDSVLVSLRSLVPTTLGPFCFVNSTTQQVVNPGDEARVRSDTCIFYKDGQMSVTIALDSDGPLNRATASAPPASAPAPASPTPTHGAAPSPAATPASAPAGVKKVFLVRNAPGGQRFAPLFGVDTSAPVSSLRTQIVDEVDDDCFDWCQNKYRFQHAQTGKTIPLEDESSVRISDCLQTTGDIVIQPFLGHKVVLLSTAQGNGPIGVLYSDVRPADLKLSDLRKLAHSDIDLFSESSRFCEPEHKAPIAFKMEDKMFVGSPGASEQKDDCVIVYVRLA